MQLDASGADPGAEAQGVVLDLGHRLGSAGHHDVRRSGGDLAGGVQHGLEPRPAATVELQPGHAGAQPCVEGRDPADRRVLAVGIAVAEHDVVDVPLLQGGTTDQLGQQAGRQVDRAEGGECAALSSDGSADGLADHDVGHDSTLGSMSDIRKYPFPP